MGIVSIGIPREEGRTYTKRGSSPLLLFLPPFCFRDTTASCSVLTRSLEADLAFFLLYILLFFEFVFFEDEVGREGHGCIIIDFLRRCRYSHGRDMIDHI